MHYTPYPNMIIGGLLFTPSESQVQYTQQHKSLLNLNKKKMIQKKFHFYYVHEKMYERLYKCNHFKAQDMIGP